MSKHKAWAFRAHMRQTDDEHWMTKDRRRIAIKDMEPTHVVAVVELLRHVAWRAKIAEAFILLAGPRPSGDGATMAFERELECLAMMEDDDFLRRYCPPFAALLARLPECEAAIKAREDEEFHSDKLWGDNND
jgi:hypothetical protein